MAIVHDRVKWRRPERKKKSAKIYVYNAVVSVCYVCTDMFLQVALSSNLDNTITAENNAGK